MTTGDIEVLHNNNNQQQQQCSICQKLFKYAYSLKRHILNILPQYNINTISLHEKGGYRGIIQQQQYKSCLPIIWRGWEKTCFVNRGIMPQQRQSIWILKGKIYGQCNYKNYEFHCWSF